MANMSTLLVDKCIKVINDYIGVALTEAQFAELMQDNPELKEQLIEFNSPNDTMDREMLIDMVSIKVTGRSWPTYGDSFNGDDFLKEFIAGCISYGYALDKE